MDWLPDDPAHILMSLDLDERLNPSVYKVNVENGKKQRVERHKLNIRRWMTDQQHAIRLGITRNFSTGNTRVYHRFDKSEDFEVLFKNEVGEKSKRPYSSNILLWR
ncbi:hypothetical protein PN836_014685 [Ningiella sp. W23]|uniref:hypothetical protein n=1 Tax=Ningiella sp. W23 TaxID=3023715 RepID=UPI00375700D8